MPNWLDTEDGLPATYGEVMQPLNTANLSDDLATFYRDNAVFREWLHVYDRVARAEKVSSWTQWTPKEHTAYTEGNLAKFSRLRGYTPEEIVDFEHAQTLLARLGQEFGEDFAMDLFYEFHFLMETPELLEVKRRLQVMSDAAHLRARS